MERRSREQSSQNFQLISEQKIRRALDSATEEFRWGWNVVAALVSPDPGGKIGQSVVDFQLRLFDAIANLENSYREIIREEQRLIGRKPRLNTQWFAKRMAKLAGYRRAVKDGLAVGRAVGDGFAWVFYERDRNLITEHLKLQRQPLLPPFIGRLGERSSLSAMRYIDGKFLIYHGTTTFLRMGDVSFIDMKTMRVASIGELKTQQIGENKLSVTAVFLADKDQNLPKFNVKPRSNENRPELPVLMKQRLNRQIREFLASMEVARSNSAEPIHAGQIPFHYDVLQKLVERSHTKKFEYAVTDDGLLIGAVRFRNSNSLGEVLLKKKTPNVDRLLAEVRPRAEKIIRKDSNKNSLIIGTIGVESGNLISSSDILPLSMWPLSAEVLHDILFAKVMVITIYNPAYFSESLKARGYEVTTDERGRPKTAIRNDGKKCQKLENLHYFTELLQRTLLTQEGILGMIDQVSDRVLEKAEGKSFGAQIIPRIHRFRPVS